MTSPLYESSSEYDNYIAGMLNAECEAFGFDGPVSVASQLVHAESGVCRYVRAHFGTGSRYDIVRVDFRVKEKDDEYVLKLCCQSIAEKLAMDARIEISAPLYLDLDAYCCIQVS